MPVQHHFEVPAAAAAAATIRLTAGVMARQGPVEAPLHGRLAQL